VDNSEETSPLSFGFLWYIVRRWAKIALPVGLLCAILSASAVWYFFEHEFRAEALLQIRTQRPMVAVKIDDGVSAEFVETQKQLLVSQPVLNKALTNPELTRMPELRPGERAEDPRQWVQKQLEVRALGRSDLFTVAFKGPSAENAQKILNAIVQSYFALQTTRSSEQIDELLKVLREERERQLAKVKDLEKKLHEEARKLSTESSLVISANGPSLFETNPTYQGLQQRLAETEAEQQMLDVQIRVFEEQGGQQDLLDSELRQAVEEAPEVVAFLVKIEKTRKELAVFTAGSESQRSVQRRLEDYDKQLKEARVVAKERLVELNKDRWAAARTEQLAQLQNTKREFELRAQGLHEKIREERNKLEGRTSNQYDFEFLRNDLQRAKDVMQRLDDRVFALSIEFLTPKRPEQVLILQWPEVPIVPVQLYPTKQMAIAILGSFLLPFVLVGSYEFFARRLYDSKQLTGNGQLVGEISALPSRPLLSHRRSERQYHHGRAIFEESVESLRNLLCVSPEWMDANVIATASAVASEGKTSLATQLAAGWARNCDGPTLIIDGDVRDPDLHLVFEIDNKCGLVDVLEGKSKVDEAIVHWDNGLHVLPAGKLSGSPHQLFSGNRFASLIAELRKQYPRIIVDVAPILSASEVLPMLTVVDGVLLCARKDHSRTSQVQLALERLERAGIARVGTVFSGVPSQSYVNTYGDYLA
jgi:succinoglycan biosynthesis transport protein ExoP